MRVALARGLARAPKRDGILDSFEYLPKVALLHEVAVENAVVAVHGGIQQLAEQRRSWNEVELRLLDGFLLAALWRADEVALRNRVLVVLI